MEKLIWCVYQRPYPGEKISGDAFLILEQPDKGVIVLLDGLGHGEDAAGAAQKARDFFKTTPLKEGRAQIKHLHQVLRPTRGAVLGLIHLDFPRHLLSYWGVGNIRAQIYNPSTINLISVPGVVGYNLNKIVEQTASFYPGNILMMCTDGIQGHWDWQELTLKLKPFIPAQIAPYLGQQYATNNDDATVLVIQRKY